MEGVPTSSFTFAFFVLFWDCHGGGGVPGVMEGGCCGLGRSGHGGVKALSQFLWCGFLVICSGGWSGCLAARGTCVAGGGVDVIFGAGGGGAVDGPESVPLNWLGCLPVAGLVG